MTVKIIKSYIYSAIVFILFVFLFTFLLKVTSLSEGAGFICILISLSVAAGVFGLLTGNAVGSKGLICGLLAAAVITVTVVLAIAAILSAKISPALFSPYFLICLPVGALGGIIGANLKK